MSAGEGGVEEGELVGVVPGFFVADGLPGEDAVAAEAPGVDAPGGGVGVGFVDVVGGAVVAGGLAVAVFAVLAVAVVLAERAAADVDVEEAIEGVALPLGIGDVGAEGHLDVAASGGDAGVK